MNKLEMQGNGQDESESSTKKLSLKSNGVSADKLDIDSFFTM